MNILHNLDIWLLGEPSNLDYDNLVQMVKEVTLNPFSTFRTHALYLSGVTEFLHNFCATWSILYDEWLWVWLRSYNTDHPSYQHLLSQSKFGWIIVNFYEVILYFSLELLNFQLTCRRYRTCSSKELKESLCVIPFSFQ